MIANITSELQEIPAWNASCCTNTGNQRGEILVSVLTESEGVKAFVPWPRD